MRQVQTDESSRSHQPVVFLATVGAAALLGAVLAYWSWEWLAPRAEARATVVSPPVSPGAAGPAEKLFGAAPSEGGAAPATGLAVRLLGVAATPRGRGSYAIVQLDGRETRVVREGSELFPGVRLAEVHVDHVILERGGARETLPWPEKPSKPVPAAPAANK